MPYTLYNIINGVSYFTPIYVHIIQITRVMLRMYVVLCTHINLRAFRYLTHIPSQCYIVTTFCGFLCVGHQLKHIIITIIVNTSWDDSWNTSHLMPLLYI